ncbi:MAG: glycosyltransferase [Chloroflexaceae bacterium]|nr:glycosyltransferase [Chloroflexaceae bacterium]
MSFRVLHVIPSVSLLRGGPSVTIRVLGRGLVQAGLTVHVATTDDHGPGHLAVPLETPQLHDGVVYRHFRRQTKLYTASWPLTRWLARHSGDYDLVHIHAVFSYASVPAALFAARARVPYIVRPLGILSRWGRQQRRPWAKKISFQLIERHILQHAAAVQFSSERERREAADLKLRAPSVIVPNGLDLSAFRQLPPASLFRSRFPALAGRTLLLFLSRFDRVKGIDLLLPAVARLRQQRPEVALVLVGSGTPEYEAWMRSEIQQLGLQNDVVFAGFLEGEEKLAALAACDAFVLPSRSDSFGNAALEALAAGLPVVLSDQVGIWPDVVEAEAGLVAPCAVEPLAEALVKLLNHPQRQRMGENGRQLAFGRFSMEAMAANVVQLYEQVLGRAQVGQRSGVLETTEHG